MSAQGNRRLAVSTWSLHRTLGRPAVYGPGQRLAPAQGGLPLLELPAQLARVGIHTLEICHFHLPSADPGYLAEVRGALADAGVELFSLLVDGGDLTDPQYGDRDRAWIAAWLERAAVLGARCSRVIAGRGAPTAANLAVSVAGLRELAQVAEAGGVRLMVENWLTLMAGPPQVLQALDALDGRVGLCADFGNWQGATKYDDLAQILPRAESCHAKCAFGADGAPDVADFTRCLALADAAGFDGPYTLIYDGPDADEWAGLATERALVAPYLASYLA